MREYFYGQETAGPDENPIEPVFTPLILHTTPLLIMHPIALPTSDTMELMTFMASSLLPPTPILQAV